MACAGDDILLHARGEHREVSGVTCHADYQIPVLLLVDLSVEQRLLVDDVELDVFSAVEHVGPDHGSELCDILISVLTDPAFSVDGLTGESMIWNTNGEVNKAPKAVIIKNGVYVGL